MFQEARLTDSAGQKPAYNLRTLCRALDYARHAAPTYGLQRALYDGFAMAFATQVRRRSPPTQHPFSASLSTAPSVCKGEEQKQKQNP